jgi:hypothetical protein
VPRRARVAWLTSQVIICCAATGNVYTQLVMQTKMGQPLMFQNAQLYLYGVVFNGVNWVNGSRVAPAFGEIGGAEVGRVASRRVASRRVSSRRVSPRASSRVSRAPAAAARPRPPRLLSLVADHSAVW